MCGFFATQVPDTDLLLDSILEAHLKFRGPDYFSGVIKYNGWLVAHARLSIIETSTHSHQPFVTKGGMLLFNGEILNYVQLAKKYSLTAHNSDTAVLAELIDNNVLDLQELEGFFSFIYISPDGKLKHCARDKFGVKPLFLHVNREQRYTICSEPYVIKKYCNLSLNRDGIDEYKYFRAPIIAGSYFTDVKAVKPGTCLISGQYFQLKKLFNEVKRKNYTETEILETLQVSVEQRLVADVSCGLLFSGGIDSNLINEITQGRLKRYSAISEKSKNIDYTRSQQVPTKCRNLTDHDFKSLFKKMLAVRGEPLSVPNEVLLADLAMVAREDGIKVLLSGEAADEFFAGYDRIFRHFSTHAFDVKDFLKIYCYSPEVLGDKRIMDHFTKYFDQLNFLTAFEKVRYFFIDQHLPILFRRLDFSLMFSGVEGREPLASEAVLRLGLAFSSSELINPSVGKVLLRSLLANFLGEDFAFTEKVGFPVDTLNIFRENEGETAYEKWQHANLKELKWL